MKTCLLVIDVQESFRQRPYFSQRDLADYLHAQNALITSCQAQGVPVVRIFHTSTQDNVQDPFALASGHVRALDGLCDFSAAATFYKSRHSALVGTGLDVWLVQHGIQRIIITGIRTEQCCETTTRHASDMGFEVVFVPDATLTFDMQTLDGELLHAHLIKARTSAVLQGRFATVMELSQTISCIGAQKNAETPKADTTGS